MTRVRLRRRSGRVGVRLLTRLGVAVLLAVAVEFFALSYLRLLDAADTTPPSHADAIVVFSGDPSRIRRGFELLAQGQAPRLFIAGLDNGTDIDAEKKKRPALAQCCVELEQITGTTHEDAQAIAAWTRSHGFRSLLVVTTNIHMPRAMAELNGMIGGVSLIPIGISQGLYDSRDWRHNPAGWPRLVKEAAKYALVRLNNLAGYIGIDAASFL